jgi:uncharacterized peroxidase-related enzyme
MRLPDYSRGRSRLQRLALWLSRRAGAELDDVAKVSMRRPAFFGRPFLALTNEALRGDSVWSVGERELFAAVVSDANRCGFCVGTHAEIARLTLGAATDVGWQDGRYGVRVTATANLLDALTRDPDSVPHRQLTAVRSAGVDDAALIDALHVAYVFNVINRIADALDFGYRSERDRLRGARILRRNGYRLPAWLLR